MAKDEGQGQAVSRPVCETIFRKYFDTLEKEDGFCHVAQQLRKLILDDRNFAEPSIRAALFMKSYDPD